MPGTKCFQNATQSYIASGYSRNGAKENACLLLQKEDIQQEIEKLCVSNSIAYNITPAWIKDQCYIMYDRCKSKNDHIAAKSYLELAGKCVGAFKTAPDVDKIDSIEPQDTQQAITRLKADLKLLEDQGKAGTGLPPIDAQDKP